jgi:hypothetical protein
MSFHTFYFHLMQFSYYPTETASLPNCHFHILISFRGILRFRLHKCNQTTYACGNLISLYKLYLTGCFDGLSVFISVSAIAQTKHGALQDRLIEINWNHADPGKFDWVGLFDHPPETGISDPLETVNVTLSRGNLDSFGKLK